MLTARHDVPLFRALLALFGIMPIDRADLGWIMFFMALFAGLTWSPTRRTTSFKDFGRRRSVPFVVLVLAALLIAGISVEPTTMLFVLFFGYALSGYAVYAWRRAKGQHISIVSTSTDELDERGLHG